VPAAGIRRMRYSFLAVRSILEANGMRYLCSVSSLIWAAAGF